LYLKEDLNDIGDITTDSLFTVEKGEAEIIAKEKCVVAGLEEAEKVFKKTKAKTRLIKKDGEWVDKNEKVAYVEGTIRSILIGERLALNFICKMSGIATETRKIVNKCKKINPGIEIAATRKTTPGFRKFEKKAVIIGGGIPHRFGLYDEILIKDNHLKKIGSVEKTIKKIRQRHPDKTVEIEVESLRDAIKAAEANADIIMLDNFTPKKAQMTAEKIKNINPNIKIEISGGVTPKNIVKYAYFADRISLGYLTHSVKNRDFSLTII